MIEQEMFSTVFDKKVCFHVSKLKKCRTKSVVSRDFLRSACSINLFQEENGTFFQQLNYLFLIAFSHNPLMASKNYDDIRHSRHFQMEYLKGE